MLTATVGGPQTLPGCRAHQRPAQIISLLAGYSQERVASGELEGAAGMLPLEAAAKAGGLNWSELYAIVGSLFESNMSVPQHLAMLNHLPREQRCAAASA